MDDYEMEDAESFGLGGLPSEEEGEETANITAAASRGALMFGGPDIQAKYGEAVKRYEQSTEEVLKQISAARDRLLKQPTEQSRGEQLRGLAMALAAPRERDDPRFYERRNLYTFLRDVGAYGAEQQKAEKAAKLKQEEDIAKIDELKAKYEQQSALGLIEKLGPAFRESLKKPTEKSLQADAQKIIDLQSIIDDPNRSQSEKDAAKRQIDAIGKQTAPEDRSVLGQIVRANRMLSSGNPQEVKAAQAFLAKYSPSGKPPVTVPQARTDLMINAAKEFLKTINERERAAAFAAPYPNERQQKIRKAVELAGQPTYEEVATKGGFSAELILDQDEG
jgi:hypothetical protein